MTIFEHAALGKLLLKSSLASPPQCCALQGPSDDVGASVPEGTERSSSNSKCFARSSRIVTVSKTRCEVEDAQQFPTSAGYGADIINEVGKLR